MAREGRSAPAYAYSENNPLSKQDPDGRLTGQYRRDARVNDTVRRLEPRLRQELIDQCAKGGQESEQLSKQLGRQVPSATTESLST